MPQAPSELMLQVMGRLSLFKGFSPSQLRMLMGLCEHRAVEEGDVLCEREEAAECMYVLVAGELELLSEKEERLSVVSPVQMVGEGHMLTGEAYPETVRATKTSHVFAIARFPFERFVRRDPEAQLKVYRNLAESLMARLSGSDHEEEAAAMREASRRQERRIAALERLAQQQECKVEAAMELASQTSELGREGAEYRILEALKGQVPRVLIVDDEPEFRRFVRSALSAYMVVEAGSGREALDMVEEEQLDLIIADIRMPQMDGFTLLENLRSRFPGLPVLATSGFLSEEDLLNYGFDGFIDKPVIPQCLQQTVAEILTPAN